MSPVFSPVDPEQARSSLRAPEKSEKNSYVEDFVSGQLVKAGPEEVEATQVMTERLVKELGYPKAHIQTRPQYKIKHNPSGEDRWPADAVLFAGTSRAYSDIYAIVECKRKRRKDGKDQLQVYLQNAPSAQLGIWFNGKDTPLYLWKTFRPDRSIEWVELPAFPRYGQPIRLAARRKQKDLAEPTDLVKTFKEIRNYLAGSAAGITRDEALARQIKILGLLKVFDELHTPPNDEVRFWSDVAESPEQVKANFEEFFRDVKGEYESLFDQEDVLVLDARSLYHVVGQIQHIALTKAPRDALVSAFEVFIGPATRGTEGQFHTPSNAVRTIVSILDPKPGEYFLDDACGGGTFLVEALKHVWKRLEEQKEREGRDEQWLGAQKNRYITQYLRGIEKDSFLAKMSGAWVTLYASTTGTDTVGAVHCADSLYPEDEWPAEMRRDVRLGRFDVMGVNPPYGSKIRVTGEHILKQFDLAHRWAKDEEDEGQLIFEKGALLNEQAPQLLFLERNLAFLKEGGRMGIVLLESIFGMPKYRYVVDWLLKRAEIYAVIAMPEDLFQPHTHAKTCLVFIKKTAKPRDDYDIFMATAKRCGHDSMQRPIPFDDLPTIAERYREMVVEGQETPPNHLGFLIKRSQLNGTILIPKYYDPEIQQRLEQLRPTHDLKMLRELHDVILVGADGSPRYKTGPDGKRLIDRKRNPIPLRLLELSVGHEPGKLEYGLGPIPFIRTSDITNWELKYDPKQSLSEDLYQELGSVQDIRAGDILFVRDGTYLVGTSCILTEHDTRIVICGGMYRIRINDRNRLDPYLLLAVLNSPIVKQQIRAKQFTRDVIDTLGHRIQELVLPIPKDPETRRKIAVETKEVVDTRAALRERARNIVLGVTATVGVTEEELELVETL